MRIALNIISGMIVACILGGCLSRTYYYEPTSSTIATGPDGYKRGAIKEEGQYPFWSEAPGKSFLNPTVSLVGKNVQSENE